MAGKESFDEFSASLARCRASRGFIDRFYSRFMGASPEARALFSGTAIERRKRMLSQSLYICLMFVGGVKSARPYLDYLASKHVRLGVVGELYRLWLASLVEAVRETDPRCDARTVAAWRATLTPAIEYILGAGERGGARGAAAHPRMAPAPGTVESVMHGPVLTGRPQERRTPR